MGAVFRHAATLRSDYPQLVAVALRLSLKPDAQPDYDAVSIHINQAKSRLATQSEGEFPEIQAWRRVFGSMGFKPTKYRSASEALLRRLRIDGDLPTILPIIDVCNAASVSFAVPVAVFDVDHIVGDLTVRYADGSESFETFGGEIETPPDGEVIFCDDSGKAHARRWPHKQARTSAARPESTEILIVSEAMHEGAVTTQASLGDELAKLLQPMASSLVGPQLVDSDGFRF